MENKTGWPCLSVLIKLGLSYHLDDCMYDKIMLHNYNTYKKCILENALSGNWIHSIQRFVNNVFDLVIKTLRTKDEI